MPFAGVWVWINIVQYCEDFVLKTQPLQDTNHTLQWSYHALSKKNYQTQLSDLKVHSSHTLSSSHVSGKVTYLEQWSLGDEELWWLNSSKQDQRQRAEWKTEWEMLHWQPGYWDDKRQKAPDGLSQTPRSCSLWPISHTFIRTIQLAIHAMLLQW